MVAIRVTIIALTFVLLGSAVAQGTNGVEQRVNEVTQQWAELLNQGDAPAFADLHTDDALVRHASGAYNDGSQEIRAWAQGAYDSGIRFEAVAAEAGSLGEDVAFGRGTWAASSEAGQLLMNGEWIAVYNLIDGEWKIFRLFSGSLPLPEQDG